MEDSQKKTCGSCAFSGQPDEDGMVECRYWPPELFNVGREIQQLRPRLYPQTPGCGMHIPSD